MAKTRKQKERTKDKKWAKRHGEEVTFRAKPLTERNGSRRSGW